MPTLDWHDKDKDVKASKEVRFRLLTEVSEYSYGDKNTGNMIVHGDNLEALKALLPYYKGRVKCIYIDPPYNTGNIFDSYDDNLEYSIWLSLIYPRVELLYQFLTDDGSLWLQIDDRQLENIKLILNELFGKNNFLNMISVKTKIAGVSGSYLGNTLQNNVEYILGYAKNVHEFTLFERPCKKTELLKYIQLMDISQKSWKYTNVMISSGVEKFEKDIVDGYGNKISIFSHSGYEFKNIKNLADELYDGDIKKAYYENIDRIFDSTNAQSSIRARVMMETKDIDSDLLSIVYVPQSGKNANHSTRLFYKGPKRRLFTWLSDTVIHEGNLYYKTDNIGNLWDDFQYNNLTKEGDCIFPNGKKPEKLVQRILSMCTIPGDIVLDSYLGSGTTSSVAQKMNRNYIGIEIGDHAITHIVPRMQKVINGEQGGISKDERWEGGGGYKFYRLGDPLYDDDGLLNKNVNVKELGAFIFYKETQTSIPENSAPPFLGTVDCISYYLLYSSDKDTCLNLASYKALKAINGKKVIYADICRMSAKKLKEEQIEFKQIPYDLIKLGR